MGAHAQTLPTPTFLSSTEFCLEIHFYVNLLFIYFLLSGTVNISFVALRHVCVALRCFALPLAASPYSALSRIS